ncbi:AAEL010684-PA [Aedes aegypti]|nr:AAEL010684-PA [Aedes aegypti]
MPVADEDLSHLKVVSGGDKMSLEDFDQYLGSYIGDEREFALVLDFDGTLAELTSHPNLSAMTPEMKETLENIANSGRVFVTIISGRDVHGVKEKVGIKNIVYSGNHGLEVLYPDGRRHNQGISKELSDNFGKMVEQLTNELAHDGAWVENKKVSLTFHIRQVDPKLVPQMEARAAQIIESYGYRANKAHAAIEGKPPIHWNKGLAAELILKSNFDRNWETRKVIFAGDDTTDEDVMIVIKGFGRSFRVSNDANVQTNADFRIPSVKSVFYMLKWIEQKVCA